MGRAELPLVSFPSFEGFQEQLSMSKISLIILGLVLLVCLTAAASEEEISSLREVREADPEARRRQRNKRKHRNGKGKGKKGSRRRKNRMNKNKSSRQTATISSACFEQSITIMKMWKDVISNFEKQKKRMEKQNTTAGNKSGKKSLFGSIAQMLVEAGGGNKSAPSCGGSTTNDGAKQLANLTSTLDSCKDDIHKACDPSNIPQPNMTFIMMCDDLVTQFKAGAMACLNKSVGGFKTTATEACTCWTNTDLAAIVTKAKMCKASDEAKAISAALKTCTAAFGKCRKFEDDANTAITACGSDSSKLTAKATTLSANSAALTAAQAKVATLTNSTRRMARTASTCAEVVTYATDLAAMAKNFPASPAIVTTAAKITGASVTCSEAEKTSLTTVQADLVEAVATVDTALEAVQTQLMTLTGSTVSVTDATTAGPTSTKAARRQRNFNLM